MSFAGIDPAGLADLGGFLEQKALTIAAAASRAFAPLERHGRHLAADRLGTSLSAIASVLRASAADFGWRIAAVHRHERGFPQFVARTSLPISGADLAVGLPFGVEPGRGAGAVVYSRLEIDRLSAMGPAEVAAFFGTRTAEEIGVLVAAQPELVTDLDGAPPWARYAASDILIGRRLAELRAAAAVAGRTLGEGDLQWFQRRMLQAHLEDVTGAIAEYERWLVEDRQILLFDPGGDGRAVEVFGDLATAAHIGVVVPGVANDLENFASGTGLRSDARSLHGRAGELGVADVATVAWLGYDPPDGLDALGAGAARGGADSLVRFVAGLDALPGRRRVTVVGHSYGSLVTGLAARTGLAADEIVFVGSPGTGLAHAGHAKLKPGGVVWAALAAGDPIGAGIDLREFLTPEDQLEQAVRRLLDSLEGENDIKDLHHGTNPAHEDFGAIEINTDGSTGHSEYFKPHTVTLDNLLYIIAGMDHAVSVDVPATIELAPGPIDEPWDRLEKWSSPAKMGRVKL